MKGDYESSWFCWEVCFGSRTGANSSAHRNNVSALFSSSCFSMSGVPCFAWALGTDMWRRILWKPATHHEPAHGPYYPPGVLLQSRSLRWVDIKWEGCWSLGGCARGQMGQKLWRQWWVAGRWWKKHRWHRATGLAYTVCLCQWRRIGLLPNLACRQFGEEWGVFWLGLWTGTFSKHHRPQGAARGYWLHGKGRGPRGRDGEHRPTQNHRGAMRGMIDNKPNLNLCLFQDTTAVFGQFVPQRRFFQIRGRMWKTVQDSVRFLKKQSQRLTHHLMFLHPAPRTITFHIF